MINKINFKNIKNFLQHCASKIAIYSINFYYKKIIIYFELNIIKNRKLLSKYLKHTGHAYL